MTSIAKPTPQGRRAGKRDRAALTFTQFEALCDDPARDRMPTRGNVRAVLAFDPRDGFLLSAQDGSVVHEVTEPNGEPVRFRTIEQALARLGNVSGLSPEIGLVMLREAR
jgi:hypothetical protein